LHLSKCAFWFWALRITSHLSIQLIFFHHLLLYRLTNLGWRLGWWLPVLERPPWPWFRHSERIFIQYRLEWVFFFAFILFTIPSGQLLLLIELLPFAIWTGNRLSRRSGILIRKRNWLRHLMSFERILKSTLPFIDIFIVVDSRFISIFLALFISNLLNPLLLSLRKLEISSGLIERIEHHEYLMDLIVS